MARCAAGPGDCLVVACWAVAAVDTVAGAAAAAENTAAVVWQTLLPSMVDFVDV